MCVTGAIDNDFRTENMVFSVVVAASAKPLPPSNRGEELPIFSKNKGQVQRLCRVDAEFLTMVSRVLE
jgi:hypothetical protein